jgi:excisionase family DNA binding protein
MTSREPAPPPAQEWLSTAQAAQYLGLTSHRIRAEFASGRLPGTRLGYRTLRFKREHLDDLMASLLVVEKKPAPTAIGGVAGLVPHKRRGIGHSLTY